MLRSPPIPDTLARVLDLEPEIERIATDQAATTRALVIARGFEYATAREWALKLKELARVFADPYSSADFQHGPLTLVEPGVPVLAVVRSGAPGADLVALLGRLRTDLGGDLMVVSDHEPALDLATWPVRLPAGTPEWLGPIVSIVAGQLHALHLTRARGLDPERPAQPQQGHAHDLANRRAGAARSAGAIDAWTYGSRFENSTSASNAGSSSMYDRLADGVVRGEASLQRRPLHDAEPAKLVVSAVVMVTLQPTGSEAVRCLPSAIRSMVMKPAPTRTSMRRSWRHRPGDSCRRRR